MEYFARRIPAFACRRVKRGDSEFVGILGHGEAGEGLARAFSYHLDAKNGGGLLAGRTKDGESGEGFAIKAGDEEALVAARLLPNLTNLYFGNGHGVEIAPKMNLGAGTVPCQLN
jgi:hypothetical protein